jgi:hypothetical protein
MFSCIENVVAVFGSKLGYVGNANAVDAIDIDNANHSAAYR